jgi:YceI-like domain
MVRRVVTVVVLIALAACAAPHPRRSHAPGAIPAGTSLRALPPPGDYKIDSGHSELRLLVYRAGPLARLGHNHVMVNRAVTGHARIGESLASTSFWLSVPVSAFSVDDAQSRSEEGDDFPGEIPEDAKEGTRRNMLSAAVLNAAQFPDITVTSAALSGTLQSATAEVEISAAGHNSRISVPLTLQGDPQHLIGIGSAEVRQTALGLAPYSLLGGALQVQDAMQLKFKITLATQ